MAGEAVREREKLSGAKAADPTATNAKRVKVVALRIGLSLGLSRDEAPPLP